MGKIENNREYNKKTYKNLSAQIKIAEYAAIDNYCNLHGISKARFIVWACNYFMERGELPPESEIQQMDNNTNTEE